MRGRPVIRNGIPRSPLIPSVDLVRSGLVWSSLLDPQGVQTDVTSLRALVHVCGSNFDWTRIGADCKSFLV